MNSNNRISNLYRNDRIKGASLKEYKIRTVKKSLYPLETPVSKIFYQKYHC